MNETQHGRWANTSDSRKTQESWQRWAPIVGGGTLAALGLIRRSKAGWALAAAGGALAIAGATTSSSAANPELSANILVNASPQEAYRRWRALQDSPQWMNHIQSVEVLDDRRSHWTAYGPMGTSVQWTAEITNERDGEALEWHSLPGSDLNVQGYVQFQRSPNDRGTIVTSHMQYRLANAALRAAASGFIGRQAKFFMRQDMRRFKTLLETGEVPTTQGQSHGPRSAMDLAGKAMDPNRPLRKRVQGSEGGVLESLRRVS